MPSRKIFHPIVLFQTCTSLSDRAGYFFAQRSHCGKKEEIDQRKPKNIREEKNLEIIPCDGVPGSNATVNKCGHCYTDPKEAKIFINNCGTCRNEPCCSEGDLDPCGNCPGQGTLLYTVGKTVTKNPKMFLLLPI